MLINIQDDIIRLHAAGLLTKLLVDKTTGKNIMWATDVYAEHGTRYERNEQIMPELITGANTGIIKTRARKAFEQQTERTRRRAEVFTPLWICRKMNDHYYNECVMDSDPKKSIDSRQLEITCGEAPFLVSRYDTTTGEIIPISERIGLLDRKLRIVGENAKDEKEWLSFAKRAYESTYGYEFQGDNLLIARVNLIETFAEYMCDRWQREPTAVEMRPIINIITWNVWQMDGLSGKIPYKTADEDNVQLSFFEEEIKAEQPLCRIFDWRARRPLEYNTMGKGNKTMKFDFVIGNPPYQDDTIGEKGFAPPIYNYFIDSSYEVGNVVELIHPARFLFNAGSTPKEWNQKMLSDSHIKVLFFEQDSSKVFTNTDIKGGVTITYRDSNKEFGAIEIYTLYSELNSILRKVKPYCMTSISDIVFVASKFNLDSLLNDYPECRSRIKEKRITTNVLDIPAFSTQTPDNSNEYVRIFGRENNTRVYKWIEKKYIEISDFINNYKIFVAKANGIGAFGETLTDIEVGKANTGHSHSFIGIGSFSTEIEAINLQKYIKTKFSRCMLSILKITQDLTAGKWKYVPLQDFTPSSDIDWSKSIPEIDKQLYAKYGLTDDEITFIETHVKEMS